MVTAQFNAWISMLKLTDQKGKHIVIFRHLFIQCSAVSMSAGIGAQQDWLIRCTCRLEQRSHLAAVIGEHAPIVCSSCKKDRRIICPLGDTMVGRVVI